MQRKADFPVRSKVERVQASMLLEPQCIRALLRTGMSALRFGGGFAVLRNMRASGFQSALKVSSLFNRILELQFARRCGKLVLVTPQNTMTVPTKITSGKRSL